MLQVKKLIPSLIPGNPGVLASPSLLGGFQKWIAPDTKKVVDPVGAVISRLQAVLARCKHWKKRLAPDTKKVADAVCRFNVLE